MPNIVVRLPTGFLEANGREILVRRINEAAMAAEQMSGHPRARQMCWVLIDEVAESMWTCGAVDQTSRVIPFMIQIFVPAGVLDDRARSQYVESIHNACQAVMPVGDSRSVQSSVLLTDVPDGSWGVNGSIWNLTAFARAAGFAHLQAK